MIRGRFYFIAGCTVISKYLVVQWCIFSFHECLLVHICLKCCNLSFLKGNNIIAHNKIKNYFKNVIRIQPKTELHPNVKTLGNDTSRPPSLRKKKKTSPFFKTRAEDDDGRISCLYPYRQPLLHFRRLAGLRRRFSCSQGDDTPHLSLPPPHTRTIVTPSS